MKSQYQSSLEISEKWKSIIQIAQNPILPPNSTENNILIKKKNLWLLSAVILSLVNVNCLLLIQHALTNGQFYTLCYILHIDSVMTISYCQASETSGSVWVKERKLHVLRNKFPLALLKTFKCHLNSYNYYVYC